MPAYINLVEDADFRRELSLLNTPELKQAIDAVEEALTPPMDRSIIDIHTIALRSQFESGARIALSRLRTLLTPKAGNSDTPLPDLRPWGGLIDEDPQQ